MSAFPIELGGVAVPAEAAGLMPAVEAMGSMTLAALLGMGVTWTRKPSDYEWGMIKAATFLALAGDLLFRVVADDMARAFGLMGAASLVRYRSGLRNPSDASALFIAIALGMACGAGFFWLAIGASLLVRVLGFLFAGMPTAFGWKGIQQLIEIEIRGRQAEIQVTAQEAFASLGIEARLVETELKEPKKDEAGNGRGGWRWVYEARATADNEGLITQALVARGLTEVRVAKKAWDMKP